MGGWLGAYSAESKGSCEAMVIESLLPLAVKVVLFCAARDSVVVRWRLTGVAGGLRRAVAAPETLRSPPPRVEVRGSGRGMVERPLAAAPPAELPVRVRALFGLQLELRATTPLCAKTREHMGNKSIEISSSRSRPVFLILWNNLFVSIRSWLETTASCPPYLLHTVRCQKRPAGHISNTNRVLS